MKRHRTRKRRIEWHPHVVTKGLSVHYNVGGSPYRFRQRNISTMGKWTRMVVTALGIGIPLGTVFYSYKRNEYMGIAQIFPDGFGHLVDWDEIERTSGSAA